MIAFVYGDFPISSTPFRDRCYHESTLAPKPDGNLTLELDGARETAPFHVDHVVETDLAVRAYGFVATGQLEAFDYFTEEVARAYACH